MLMILNDCVSLQIIEDLQIIIYTTFEHMMQYTNSTGNLCEIQRYVIERNNFLIFNSNR